MSLELAFGIRADQSKMIIAGGVLQDTDCPENSAMDLVIEVHYDLMSFLL